MASIGENIKRIRKERHLSQRQLAEMTGINVKSMSFYESSKRHIPGDWLVPLANALEVSVDELCGNTKKQTVTDELIARMNVAILDVLKDYDITSK